MAAAIPQDRCRSQGAQSKGMASQALLCCFQAVVVTAGPETSLCVASRSRRSFVIFRGDFCQSASDSQIIYTEECQLAFPMVQQERHLMWCSLDHQARAFAGECLRRKAYIHPRYTRECASRSGGLQRWRIMISSQRGSALMNSDVRCYECSVRRIIRLSVPFSGTAVN